MYTLDPDAAETSLDKIGQWDFERIVLAHGDRIEHDAKRVFAQVAEALLRRARRRAPLRQRLFRLLSRWQ